MKPLSEFNISTGAKLDKIARVHLNTELWGGTQKVKDIYICMNLGRGIKTTGAHAPVAPPSLAPLNISICKCALGQTL